MVFADYLAIGFPFCNDQSYTTKTTGAHYRNDGISDFDFRRVLAPQKYPSKRVVFLSYRHGNTADIGTKRERGR